MPDGAPGDITQLFAAWRQGDDSAVSQIVPILYEELHAIASRAMGGERRRGTLQTTALIHEAYLRLVGSDVEWQGRGHFLGLAAQTMRRVLVDHARARQRDKRGGSDAEPITLGDPAAATGPDPIDVIAIDSALEELAQLDERKARALELHFFGGLDYHEVAQVLETSAATVGRDIRFAKSWMFDRLRSE
jgi:RNA polymerase sigma factor (TIGR02999 family)